MARPVRLRDFVPEADTFLDEVLEGLRKPVKKRYSVGSEDLAYKRGSHVSCFHRVIAKFGAGTTGVTALISQLCATLSNRDVDQSCRCVALSKSGHAGSAEFLKCGASSTDDWTFGRLRKPRRQNLPSNELPTSLENIA